MFHSFFFELERFSKFFKFKNKTQTKPSIFSVLSKSFQTACFQVQNKTELFRTIRNFLTSSEHFCLFQASPVSDQNRTLFLFRIVFNTKQKKSVRLRLGLGYIGLGNFKEQTENFVLSWIFTTTVLRYGTFPIAPKVF